MEIKVSEIPPEGMTVEFETGPDEVCDLGEDMALLGPLMGSFRIKKTGSTVTVYGEARAGFELVCSRCGGKFRFDTEGGFEMDLVPFESIVREEERELQADEMEVDYYRDDTLDLGEILREQALLQVPMKPLCREDCKGLCQYCRQDLNIKDCGCVPPTGHPGLAGLKDLLKDNK